MKNITKALFLSVLCLASMSSFGMSRFIRAFQAGAKKTFTRITPTRMTLIKPVTKRVVGALLGLGTVAANHATLSQEVARLTPEEKRELDSLPHEVNAYGDTRLIKALELNMSIAVIRYLIEVERQDVNATDARLPLSVNSPMRYAVKAGSVEKINLLASHGARINNQLINDLDKEGKYSFGYMPLLAYAVAYQTPEVVQCLMANGARDDIFMGICRSDNLDNTTKSMCEYWTDLRMPTYSYGALELARQLKKDDMVKILAAAAKKQSEAKSQTEK